MNLNFNVKARKDLVRSILIDVKSRILSETDRFDIVFYKMDFLKTGFGFRFDVAVKDPAEFAEAKQEFSEIRHYLSEAFGYLFGEDVSVSSCTDDFTAEYEIVSRY